MILATRPNFTQNNPTVNIRSNYRDNKTNAQVSFCSAAVSKLLPLRKFNEPLSPITLRYLKRAEQILLPIQSTADSLVKRLVDTFVMPRIQELKTREDMKLDFGFNFLVSPYLEGKGPKPSAKTKNIAFFINAAHPIRGNFQVREGRRVYDIYLPGTEFGGKSGCIMLPPKNKRGVSLRVSLNAEIVRILKIFLDDAKKVEALVADTKQS